jgi:hypothetical protein
MNQKRQIDVDQRISGREPLPRESSTAKTVDDPFIPTQRIGVRLQEFVLRDFDAPRSELHLDRTQKFEFRQEESGSALNIDSKEEYSKNPMTQIARILRGSKCDVYVVFCR